MAAVAETTWTDLNHRQLIAAVARIRATLERHTDSPAETVPEHGGVEDPPWPPALRSLCGAFGLSGFERDVLLLCAGIELDGDLADLCATVHGDPNRPFPTFGLALAVLDEPHWSALTPDAPLRRWHLVALDQPPAGRLTSAPLQISERVLHFLVGIQHLDAQLGGLLTPIDTAAPLVASHTAVADRIAQTWGAPDGFTPVVELIGPDPVSLRQVAAAACARVQLGLVAVDPRVMPPVGPELERLLRLWEREAALSATALFVEADAADLTDTHNMTALRRLLEQTQGAIVLATTHQWPAFRRATITLDVRRPTPDEQRDLWQGLLEGEGDGQGHKATIDRLVSHFDFNAPTIRTVVRDAAAAPEPGATLADSLWAASRAQARPLVSNLARRIEPSVTWEDLVLPEMQRDVLREIQANVAHRATVYNRWGFRERGPRGLGITALFAGPSGTGKTMAAEVLAGTLAVDLYRVDLAQVISKYIGETEKNLSRVFDAAEAGAAILFFDECDAIFGKRSQVKDSHDRYANIEINYLLQRVEDYRGLAILATNTKSALDPAFLRRIRFVVNFPLPDAAQRAELWQRAFPAKTPTRDLHLGALARLELTGGSIRNIALNGAFLAASEYQPIGMTHLWRAARSEYAKLEQPMPEAPP